MPILVKCEGCQAKMNAPDAAAGKRVKCPKCQGIVNVPAAGGAAPAKPAAAPAKSNPAPAKSAAPPAKKKAAEPDDFGAEFDKHSSKEKGGKKSKEEDFDWGEDEAPSKKSGNQKKGKGGGGGGGGGDDMLAELPEEQAEAIRNQLESKERILWAGKPVPKIFVWRAAPFGCGTLVCWGAAIATFVTLSGQRDVPGVMKYLMPIGIFLLGFVFLLAPLFASKRAARTFYALTNKRALVWEGGWLFGNSFEEYGPARLSGMKKQTSWIMKGAGDLVFKEEIHVTTTTNRDSRGRYAGTSTSVRVVQHGFLGIADVNEIEKLIRREIIDKMMRALEDD
jgi:hypothetical protein